MLLSNYNSITFNHKKKSAIDYKWREKKSSNLKRHVCCHQRRIVPRGSQFDVAWEQLSRTQCAPWPSIWSSRLSHGYHVCCSHRYHIDLGHRYRVATCVIFKGRFSFAMDKFSNIDVMSFSASDLMSSSSITIVSSCALYIVFSSFIDRISPLDIVLLRLWPSSNVSISVFVDWLPWAPIKCPDTLSSPSEPSILLPF